MALPESWKHQIDRLLGRANSPETPEFIHEPLQRSARFKEELELYILYQEKEHKELLRQHYQKSLLHPGIVKSFVLLDGEHASGFMWYAELEVPEKFYTFMLDRLADMLKNFGYVEKQNEHKISPTSNGQWQESERRYLKPRLSKTEKAQQRYGNVLLEILSQNGKLKHLKVQCNRYSDRMFDDAWSFEAFMEHFLAGNRPQSKA
ncbi:MAG: hypothetical protein ACK417_09960 [Bacteroidia bacterium]